MGFGPDVAIPLVGMIGTSSVGPIERFMVEDHVRVDAWLEVSTRTIAIDEQAYGRFRHDLLRHIGMEEKVLLPYLREKLGTPWPKAAELCADHGEIARLLVRSPTLATVDELRALLARHNPLEEGPEGLYAACDAVAGGEAELLVAKLRARPVRPRLD
jgi:hypothetical protein